MNMKIFLSIIQSLLIALIAIVGFLYVLYHASGHNIPADTDNAFYTTALLLVALYVTVIVIKKRRP